jgi:hypothetical protein
VVSFIFPLTHLPHFTSAQVASFATDTAHKHLRVLVLKFLQ